MSFNLGPLAISVGQALAILALIVALIAGKIAARRRNVPISDTLFTLVLLGLICARIVFVIRYASDYGLDPLGWIDIRDRGLDLTGGLLGMALYASYVIWRRPNLRRPLSAALLTGGIAWGVTGGALTLIDNQASRPPETALYTLDGAETDLASLQQKAGNLPMVVNLWATWCPPCRAEMPMLQAAQDERQDILFVFVNQGESGPTIQAFLDSMQLDMKNIVQDSHRQIAQQAGSVGLPTTLFYDADGKLVDTHFGLLSRATLSRAVDHLGTANELQ